MVRYIGDNLGECLDPMRLTRNRRGAGHFEVQIVREGSDECRCITAIEGIDCCLDDLGRAL